MTILDGFLKSGVSKATENTASFGIVLAKDQSGDDLARQFLAQYPQTPIEVTSVFESKDGELSRCVILSIPGLSFDGDRVNPFDICYALKDALHVAKIAPLTSGFELPVTPEAEPTLLENLNPENQDYEWHLKQLRLPQAWEISQGRGVLIGQPDTGYADHHLLTNAVDRRLGCNILEGGFPDDRLLPFPNFGGHGVSTASTATSRGRDAQKSVRGAAPMATVLPVRCTDSVIISVFNSRHIAKGIEKAVNEGADVMSISLGAVGLFDLFIDPAIAHGLRHSVIFVAAAGNVPGILTYPGNNGACTCVGGSSAWEKPWILSGNGWELDVSAPASPIWRALRQHGDADNPERTRLVEASEGTSYSAAMVGGLAALWVGHHGKQNLVSRYGHNLTYAFKTAVRDSARRPSTWPREAYFGKGIADAHALLRAPLPRTITSEIGDFADERRTHLLEILRREWGDSIDFSNEEIDLYRYELQLHLSYKQYEKYGQGDKLYQRPPLSSRLRERAEILLT